MSISVNDVNVATAPETTGELSAARELLRQRAVAVGILDAVSSDEGTIDQAIEKLLGREIVTPRSASSD